MSGDRIPLLHFTVTPSNPKINDFEEEANLYTFEQYYHRVCGKEILLVGDDQCE